MILTNCWIVDLLLVAAASIGFFYLWMKQKHSYWKNRGVSSAPTHWLFGNFDHAAFMSISPGAALGKVHLQAAETDDVYGIYIFHKPFLLLRNPEVIKQVLVKDFNVFSNRYFSTNSESDKIGSKNLFTINNPEWKHLRVKMSPTFSSGKLKRLFDLMVESAEVTKKYLQDQFSDGSTEKTINIRNVCMKYVTDVISSLAFGVRTNSFDQPPPKFYTESIKITKLSARASLQFFALFFFPQITKLVGRRMLGDSTEYFRKVFWDSMDSRESSKTKRGDVIDSLLDLKNEKQDGEIKFEGDVLLAQSAMFFIAGRESSVTTISFALYELAKQPDLQQRARDEILKVLKVHGMTYSGVQEMKYLQQVISETLRFYPPAPIIDRVAEMDYKIPGTDIVIEKGTPVYAVLTGIHMDPRYHSNPTEFDPDRFSEERKDDIVPFTYMPFGEGPRICIGMRVGIYQSMVGLITILSNYEVSLDPNYKYRVDPRSVFMSAPPDFILKLKKLP